MRGVKIRWSILNNPSLGSLAASMFGQGMLLLSGPASARLLGVAGRGEYGLLVIIVTFGGFFGAAGLPTAVTYALASQGVPARYVLKVVSTAWLRLSLGAGFLSSLAVFLIVRGNTSSPRWLEAVLVAVTVMASMTASLTLACVQGEGHFRALNLLRTVSISISAVSLVLLWLVVRHATASVALGINAAANIVACLIGGTFLAVAGRASSASANVSTRSLIRYGLASLAGGNAPLETLQIDQAAVGLLLSRSELGLYAVASAFDNLPGILVSGVGMIALPQLAGAPNREARNAIMKRAVFIAAALAAAATVFAEAIVGWLLPAAFGDAFVGAVAPARVLIVAGFFMGMRRIFVVFLQGVGRPGRTGVGETLALATLLVLAALLVPILSLMGASLALLGAAVAANIYLLWALRERPGTPGLPATPAASF
jgi:O-antigen/teichoic acid export membrane protein